jgi:hypothetical protein
MWSPQTGGTEQFEMDKKIEDGYFNLFRLRLLLQNCKTLKVVYNLPRPGPER